MQFLFLFFFCRPRLYINWKWMFSCWTKLYEVKLYFTTFLRCSQSPPLKILSKENILQDKSYHIRLNQRTKHSYFIEKEKKKSCHCCKLPQIRFLVRYLHFNISKPLYVFIVSQQATCNRGCVLWDEKQSLKSDISAFAMIRGVMNVWCLLFPEWCKKVYF